jgi:hypothetical protein
VARSGQALKHLTLLALLVVGVAPFLFRGTAIFSEQELGLPRRGYGMHPVDTLRSLVAQLEDVPGLLPHPAMSEYGYVAVVADDQVLGEVALNLPSSFCEGLLYVLIVGFILALP